MLRGEKGSRTVLILPDRWLSEIELHWIVFRQNMVVLYSPAAATNDCGVPPLFDEFDRSKRRQREKERIEVKIKLTLKQTWQRHRAQLHRAGWLLSRNSGAAESLENDVKFKMIDPWRRCSLFSLLSASSILFVLFLVNYMTAALACPDFDWLSVSFALSPLFHKFHETLFSGFKRLGDRLHSKLLANNFDVHIFDHLNTSRWYVVKGLLEYVSGFDLFHIGPNDTHFEQKPSPKSPPYWNMRWPPEPPAAHSEVQKWTRCAQRILNWNLSSANCACIDWEGETELVCSWRLASSSQKLCCSTVRYESILR